MRLAQTEKKGKEANDWRCCQCSLITANKTIIVYFGNVRYASCLALEQGSLRPWLRVRANGSFSQSSPGATRRAISRKPTSPTSRSGRTQTPAPESPAISSCRVGPPSLHTTAIDSVRGKQRQWLYPQIQAQHQRYLFCRQNLASFRSSGPPGRRCERSHPAPGRSAQSPRPKRSISPLHALIDGRPKTLKTRHSSCRPPSVSSTR